MCTLTPRGDRVPAKVEALGHVGEAQECGSSALDQVSGASEPWALAPHRGTASQASSEGHLATLPVGRSL